MRDERSASTSVRARAIAFYLPQYHPIPENDEWWGPGFTEWTNVARARPLFRGHAQPHIPADLGFYDLRLAETREQQASLAQDHGIEAFCYWHYWFGDGRRVLERPFAEVLASGSPQIKFCLGWANETWTGIWHGAEDRILIEQRYPGAEDAEAHFRTLLPAFRDHRYLRVNDRPVLHVYKPGNLPRAAEFVDSWQRMARKAGFTGLYLVAGVGRGYTRFAEDGFDSGFEARIPYTRPRGPQLATRFRRRALGHPLIREYAKIPPREVTLAGSGSKVQPCVVTNWDNTPRSGRNGIVLTGATPERFRIHLRAAIESVSTRSPEERLLWVKSWNEWAEGNYLEPDLETGHARLALIHRCVGGVGGS